MLRGVGIARDFVINEIGRTQLVGGTDQLFQNLFKFFETAFESLAFRKIDMAFPGTLEQGVKDRTQQYVRDQRLAVNAELFDGNELVQDITVISVQQVDGDRFQVIMQVSLADNTTFDLPSNIRVA